jgi:hypothetical protein
LSFFWKKMHVFGNFVVILHCFSEASNSKPCQTKALLLLTLYIHFKKENTMKFTKLFATALLLATFTFACGGKKAEETTGTPTEQTAPGQATTEGAPADNAAENTATEASPADSTAAGTTEAAPAK